MLSFIVQLNQNFEKSHGHSANTLSLSPKHLEQLRNSFDKNMDIEAILQRLGMDLLLDRTVIHPHVSWNSLRDSRAS